MKKLENKFCIVLLIFIFFGYELKAQNSVTHILDNYSLAGYSILQCDNKNYIVVGTAYKDPVFNSQNQPDSQDIHILVVDNLGKILIEKVLDDESNNIAYSVCEYDKLNNTFLITATSNKIQPFAVPTDSRIYTMNQIIIDINLNVINNFNSLYFLPPANYNLGGCQNIGLRDIRGFKTIVANNRIYTVGMNIDASSIETNPDFKTKTGFIKCQEIDYFTDIFNKVVFNNDPSIPCATNSSSTIKDYDALNDIIDVPGIGVFVSGSTNRLLQNGNVGEASVAILYDYNGIKIFDWSFYSTYSDHKIYAVNAIYSVTDQLIYQLSNDEYEKCVIVKGFDPISGNVVKNYRIDIDFSNPDIKFSALKIEEELNYNNIFIAGYGDMDKVVQGLPNSTYHYNNYKYFRFNKNSNSGVLQFLGSGSQDNTNYFNRGDDITRFENNTYNYFSPDICVKTDPNMADFIGINFDKGTNGNNKHGLKIINNANNLLSYNGCEEFIWDVYMVPPIQNLINVEDIDMPIININNWQMTEIGPLFNDYDCGNVFKSIFSKSFNSVKLLKTLYYSTDGKLVDNPFSSNNKSEILIEVEFYSDGSKKANKIVK